MKMTDSADKQHIPDTRRDLRLLAIDHIFSQSMVVLTGGAFMVGLVLAMGGDKWTIGIIAAIGPLCQMAQIPAIYLVQTLRRRRLITVAGAWIARLLFLLVALIPWILPATLQIPALLLIIVAHCLLASISGCAYGSWMRDVVPERVLGRHMGKRLAVAIGVGAVLSLVVAMAAGLDVTTKALGPILPYSLIFALAGVLGVIGTYHLGGVHDPGLPKMPLASPWALIQRPLMSRSFRMVLIFMGTWAFAQNLALPFFAVYMFERLGLSLGVVVGLTVMTQLINVALFPIWGALADRFSNKAVIGASGLVLVISFLFWPIMTLDAAPLTGGEAQGGVATGFYWATWPLLIIAHVVLGVATSGVALAAGNLALKAAPRGEATAFLATNALVTGLGAAISPLLAGFLGDYFTGRVLRVSLTWFETSLTEPLNLPAFDLRGLDFLFVIAFFAGLYALHRLTAVTEKGEVEEAVVFAELKIALRRSVFSVVGPSGGVTRLVTIPTGAAIRTAQRLSKGLGR
ncbi:MAG: hypothetical protein RLN76_10650 [Phycisphaeraceae bacterium]